MPHVALHFHLAGLVWRDWTARPYRAPFALDDETRNAFLHGSVGPDMGFFPGADRRLSDLAHWVRSAALCRALTAEARTPVERAFAWGWVTHVLADVAVHPLVNERCGELMLGDRARPLSGDDAPVEHVRVEVGLDAWYCRLHPELPRTRLRPAFGRSGVRFLVRAFRRAYGAAPDPRRLLDAHLRVCRISGPLSVLQRLASCALGTAPARPWTLALRLGAHAPLAAIAAACPRGSHAEGLFSPRVPPAWMVREVEAVEEGFADWFAGHYASDLRFLRDHDLDTGEPSPVDSPRAARALAELRGEPEPVLAAA